MAVALWEESLYLTCVNCVEVEGVRGRRAGRGRVLRSVLLIAMPSSA